MAIAPIQAQHGRYIKRSFIFPQSASAELMRFLNLLRMIYSVQSINGELSQEQRLPPSSDRMTRTRGGSALARDLLLLFQICGGDEGLVHTVRASALPLVRH
jgi:hypothetical protein